MKKRKYSQADILITLLVIGALLGSQLLSELPESSGILGAGQFEKQGNDWPCRKTISSTAEENDARCESGICSIETRKCIPPGDLWETCHRDKECGMGLECISGDCRLQPGQACSPTGSEDQCSSRRGTPTCSYSELLDNTVCMTKRFTLDKGDTCDIVEGADFYTCMIHLECNNKKVCDYR